MNDRNAGFTLIEMMVVVAIIGILTAIGLPTYRNYVIQVQVASALRELAPTKLLAEEAIVRHVFPTTNISLDGYIGSNDTVAKYCNFSVDATTLNATTITCTLKNVDYTLIAVSAKLELIRAPSTGDWDCVSTNISPKFVPLNCL